MGCDDPNRVADRDGVIRDRLVNQRCGADDRIAADRHPVSAGDNRAPHADVGIFLNVNGSVPLAGTVHRKICPVRDHRVVVDDRQRRIDVVHVALHADEYVPADAKADEPVHRHPQARENDVRDYHHVEPFADGFPEDEPQRIIRIVRHGPAERLV